MLNWSRKAAGALCALALMTTTAGAQQADKLRIGVSTFLSGAGAVFGVPARDAAQLLAEGINAQGGIGGAQVELTFIDENHGVDNVVTEYRRLAEAGAVDAMVIGLSSSICLAVAPVAEQLRMPTVFWDCGTSRLYEENQYEHVFRTADFTAANNVAAALYLLRDMPEVKTIAGINQDYAFGRDNWAAFKGAVQAIRPDIKFVAELFPKLGTADYSTEISRLSAMRPDVVFTTLWGGDMNTFVKQGASRALFRNTRLVAPNGEASLQQLGKAFPENAIVGMRGDSWAFNPAKAEDPAHREFVESFRQRTGAYPSFPAYHMAQAITAIQAALADWDGRKDSVGDTLRAGLDGMTLENFTGKLTFREDKQAVEGQLFGVTRQDPERGFATLEKLVVVPPEVISPPVGVKSDDWLRTLTPAALEAIAIPAQ